MTSGPCRYWLVLLIVFMITSCSQPSNIASTTGNTAHFHAETGLGLSPVNPERRAILHALRQRLQGLLGTDLVFAVKYLKAKDGWAWIHALPRSSDGKNHYEDVFALLHRQKGVWSVEELACTEEGSPACMDNPAYYSGLKRRFPGIPGEILPDR